MASVFITNANIDWGSEALLARYADRERDFFDLGANIGYYAAYFSPLVRRSYAFEPDVRNYPGLRKNASLSPNIEIIEAAVSSRNGTAELFPGSRAAVSSLERIDGVRPVSVRVTTIDSFVAEHPGINPCLVKIDIEDHDIQALRGMEKTITEFQPLILTECELNSELWSLCGRWKYEIYGFVRDRKTLKTCFRHFPPAGGTEEWTNMLFLVPQALNLEFASLAAA
ncbi:MAG: FkbM family methyltransferase [Acidobacteriaceae bacterium]